MALSKISKVSKVHPVEKIILSIFPIVVIGFSHKAFPIILNIIVFILLHVLCENNRKVVVKFTFEIAAFAAFSSITFVFDYGINYCFIILLKSLSAALCLSFFSLTTPIDDALFIFSKYHWLKDICDIAKSMERFLVIIDEEYGILYNSIKARGGFDGVKLKIRNTGKMAGLLFVNTMNRWKCIKDGLDSRGYRGYTPYLTKEFNFSMLRFMAVCIYIVLLGSLIFVLNNNIISVTTFKV
ncbi:cobalt ABC transporter permease [Clostridium sp. DJ247]|nr:cobalt ABC transporter permease [Clostridium sp. DJ247]